MVILSSRNKITDFLLILAWASPFNVDLHIVFEVWCQIQEPLSRQLCRRESQYPD